MSEPPSVKEQLTAHFDKSATVVRGYADRFETVYARPALKSTATFFEQYPIFSIFLAIFFALALFPVITFLVLSLFTVLSFFFLALCCAFVASSAIVLFFLSILVSVLVATALASAFLTVLTFSSYITYRFLVLVRSNGREGVSDWAAELKGRFVPLERRPREGSDGSMFVVDAKEPSSDWTTDTEVKQEGS